MKSLFWFLVVVLSGTGSVLVVRLASPLALDDKAVAAVLFFLLPAIPILILARIRRIAGIALAILIPAFWLILWRGSSDSLLLWGVPAAAGIGIVALAVWREKVSCRPAALALVALAIGALLWPGPGAMEGNPRVLLIGIDGAKWERIDTLVAEGRMPTLKRLLERGHRTTLQSLPSLFSPQVWTTIASGCSPEEHGILDFGNTRSDLRVGRIWDQMKLEDRSFGLYGWYFTWPPLPGLGDHDFVVPSTLAPDSQAFPPECSFFWKMWARERLQEKEIISYPDALLAALRQGVRLSTLRRTAMMMAGRRLGGWSALDRAWRNREIYAAIQGDLYVELLRTRSPEFSAVLFKQVDRVSHEFWKYLEPEGFPEVTGAEVERYGNAIDNVYAEVDRNLQKILDCAPRDTDVLIASDHGFRPVFGKIERKYCRVKTTNLIKALDLEDEIFGSNVGREVFLRPLVAGEAEKDSLLDRVETLLAESHLSGETKPFLKVSREDKRVALEVAYRKSIPRDSHLVLDGLEFPLNDLMLATEDKRLSGGHHPDGIYLLSGPATARSRQVDSLHVLDVTPTVAALLHLPVSPLWTGLAAVERPGTAEPLVVEYPLPTRPDVAEAWINEDLKQKLKSIGYLE